MNDQNTAKSETSPLVELLRVMKAAPADRVHMRTWSEVAPCGTAYCAAGWAAVDPWFQKNTKILEVFWVSKEGLVEPLVFSPFEPLADIFGITLQNSATLFGYELTKYGDPHVVSKEKVINNIHLLLDGEDADTYQEIDDDEESDDE